MKFYAGFKDGKLVERDQYSVKIFKTFEDAQRHVGCSSDEIKPVYVIAKELPKNWRSRSSRLAKIRFLANRPQLWLLPERSVVRAMVAAGLVSKTTYWKDVRAKDLITEARQRGNEANSNQSKATAERNIPQDQRPQGGNGNGTEVRP